MPPGTSLKFDSDGNKAEFVTKFLLAIEQFAMQKGALPADIGQYVDQSARIKLGNFVGLNVPLPTTSQAWVFLLQSYVDGFGSKVGDALRDIPEYANQVGNKASVSVNLVMYGINTVANDIKVAVRSCSSKDRNETQTRNLVTRTFITALPKELAGVVCTKMQLVRQAGGEFLVPPTVTWLSLLACISEEATRMANDPMLSVSARSDFLRLEAKPQLPLRQPVLEIKCATCSSSKHLTEDHRGHKPAAKPADAPPNGGAGRPQRAAAADRPRGCYNCHDTAHLLAACPKRCQFDALPAGCNKGSKCGLAKSHKNSNSK